MSKDLDKELDKNENLKPENKPKIDAENSAAITSHSIRSIAEEAVTDSKDKGLVDIDEALDISSVIEELEAEETKRRLERIQRDAFKHDKSYLAARKREMKEKKALRKAKAEAERIKAEEEKARTIQEERAKLQEKIKAQAEERAKIIKEKRREERLNEYLENKNKPINDISVEDDEETTDAALEKATGSMDSWKHDVWEKHWAWGSEIWLPLMSCVTLNRSSHSSDPSLNISKNGGQPACPQGRRK